MQASTISTPALVRTLTLSGKDRKEVTATNNTVEFSSSPLADGDCGIQAAKSGFPSLELKGIVLEIGEPLR